MKRLVALMVAALALALAGVAQACNTASHGHDNCEFSNFNGSPQYSCFSGQSRFVSDQYQNTQVVIAPSVSANGSREPTMNGACCVSYWTMLEGGTVPSWIQVGYIIEPNFGVPELHYFLDYRDGVHGSEHVQYNIWAWPNDGAHTFRIYRQTGTEYYYVYIDGTQPFGGPFYVPGIAYLHGNGSTQVQENETEAIYYTDTAVCARYHATFTGSQFDSGYGKDGVNEFFYRFGVGAYDAGDVDSQGWPR